MAFVLVIGLVAFAALMVAWAFEVITYRYL